MNMLMRGLTFGLSLNSCVHWLNSTQPCLNLLLVVGGIDLMNMLMTGLTLNLCRAVVRDCPFDPFCGRWNKIQLANQKQLDKGSNRPIICKSLSLAPGNWHSIPTPCQVNPTVFLPRTEVNGCETSTTIHHVLGCILQTSGASLQYA